METVNRAFFDNYLDAWNAHDSAAVARHMAHDAIYEDRGRIAENRDYYNLAELLTQLGISPPAPSS